MRVLLVFWLILFVAQSVGAEDCPSSLSAFLANQGFVEVELSENTAKQFEVEAILNEEPVLLIVDTGASHTIFSRDRLKKLGLSLEKTDIAFFWSGKKQALYSTEIADLKIADASTGPISIFASDLSDLRKMLKSTGSREADGIIGADFLSRWSAIVEVKHSKLYLRIR